MNLDQSHAEFLPTPWTLLVGLRSGSDEDRHRAEAVLVERYWSPVYAALRNRGVSATQAQEVTQGFFADVVLGRNLLDTAAPDRGRLRSLMLKAVRNYRIDLARARSRRGGDHLPIDCVSEHESSEDGRSLELTFDRAWATTILRTAVDRVRTHFQSSGRLEHWSLFEKRALGPAIHATEPPALVDAIEGTSFASPAAGAAAVQVVKRRLHSVIHDLVAETVDDPVDVTEEWQHLSNSLRV